MGELFPSGRIVDLIVVLVLVEAVVLSLYHRMTRRGLGTIDVVMALLPGGCLLLALRAALTHAPWTSVATWLAAALATHLADLWRRHR
jgi:hypothetical protein